MSATDAEECGGSCPCVHCWLGASSPGVDRVTDGPVWQDQEENLDVYARVPIRQGFFRPLAATGRFVVLGAHASWRSPGSCPGSFLFILPLFGLWMLPLGMLAQDVPLISEQPAGSRDRGPRRPDHSHAAHAPIAARSSSQAFARTKRRPLRNSPSGQARPGAPSAIPSSRIRTTTVTAVTATT